MPQQQAPRLSLDKLTSKYYFLSMAKTKTVPIKEYAREFARKGGKARAAKYPKSRLRKWAKLGGRPPKKGKGA